MSTCEVEIDALVRELDRLGIGHVDYGVGDPDTVRTVIFRGGHRYEVRPSFVVPGSLRVTISQDVYAKTSSDVLELCGVGAEP